MQLQGEVDNLEKKNSVSTSEIGRVYERLQHVCLLESEARKQLDAANGNNIEIESQLQREQEQRRLLEAQIEAKEKELQKATNAAELLQVVFASDRRISMLLF